MSAEDTVTRDRQDAGSNKAPGVVRAVAARELREHLLSVRYWLTVATTLLLVVLSTLAGVFNYRVQAEQYQLALARGEQRLREAATWSQVEPALVRPPAPLAVLNAGFDAREGRVTLASDREIPVVMEDSPVGTPYLARFGGFDVTTVAVYLLGLLAILLSFDAISGERERGTLALTLSNSLDRWQVLSGKYLGGMAALCLALSGALTAAVLTWLASGLEFPAGQAARVGLWFLALLLYLSAMFLAGLLVSMLTRRPARSLLVGMLTWFVLVIFIPAAGAAAAGRLAHPPSSYELTSEVYALEAELERRSDEAKRALGPAPTSEGLAITMEGGVSMNFYSPEAYGWWLRYYAERARLEREVASKVYERIREFQEGNRAQAALAFRLSSLSPAAHLERVENEVTATSREDVYHFLEAARLYRRELLDFYDREQLTTSLRWITDDPPGQESPFKGEGEGAKGGGPDTEQAAAELGSNLYEQVLAERRSGKRSLPLGDLPRFNFAPRPLSSAVRAVAPSLAALLLINLLCAAAAGARFRRYDARPVN